MCRVESKERLKNIQKLLLLGKSKKLHFPNFLGYHVIARLLIFISFAYNMQIKLLFQTVCSLVSTNICEKLSEIGGRLHYPHVTKDLAKEIETLWEDETYARGNELQVPDCTKYFMENLQRLSDVNYVPTKVLKIYHSIAVCKNRNSNPKFIPVGENKRSGEVYRLFDVGGKRNERRKWIHLFEGVTPVIYCAAISEYDQTLFEDDSKNRMMKPRNFLNGYLSSHVLRFHVHSS
ncbi:heterotrimeric GTP-binding protein alpha subunit, putative [Medicago truncatula]|uniref:Guanine nucleotide-binding protein alpha subunit n=1 Tax=Medicago truncatula TaxID=3880 RepID=G7J934_MEDTR|nr:heterotrimeric GTP-binding protein alpha subunit, putative [Medicago truncatula]